MITHLLNVLLGESSLWQNMTLAEHHIQNMRKHLPSYRYLGRDVEDGNDDVMSTRCLELGFRFLEEEGISGDEVVTTMLRLSVLSYPRLNEFFLYQVGPGPEWIYWLGPPYWHTPAQFELLVD